MTSGTNTIRGALVVLLAVPFHTRFTVPTFLAMLPVIRGNPSTPAEAVEKAVKVVLITIPQASTQEFKLKSLPFFAVLLALSVTCPRPAGLPLGESRRVRSNVSPRRIVIQHHVYHEIHIELFDVGLI